MLLEKLLAILLHAKGGVVAIVLATSTAVTVTGTIGSEVIDLTVTPVAAEVTPTPTPAPTLTPATTPTPAPTPTATPTATPEPTPITSTATVGVACSDEGRERDAALAVLGDAGDEAADMLRLAGAVALTTGAERAGMREALKDSGHDIRDVLKDAMHDVRDLAKELLGDCDESGVEGLVSRLEHGLDEVAEVHEEFEKERRAGGGTSVFVVTMSATADGLAEPYRARVDEALDDLEDLLMDLGAELD